MEEKNSNDVCILVEIQGTNYEFYCDKSATVRDALVNIRDGLGFKGGVIKFNRITLNQLETFEEQNCENGELHFVNGK